MNTFEYKEAVEAAVSQHNFHEAFRLLRVMLSADSWRLRADLEAAEEDYSRIIGYALTGAPDPGRDAQISALSTRIYSILDMLLRESMIADHSSLYFSSVRTNRLNRRETLQGLLAEYIEAARNASTFALAVLSKSDAAARRRVVEDLEPRLFTRVWTTTPLTFDEIASLRSAMQSADVAEHFKQLMVGALTMSLLQFFSEPLLRLLLEFAGAEYSEAVQVRSTVGAVLVMARWPRRTDSPQIKAQLDALREQGRWSADVEQTVMQFVRSADVEKITKTMREEIIPEMMKLRPDIEKHIKESGFDQADLESNPEWEEMLDKSGLTERLRKLSEMQFEGGDLFFSAFSMLKNFAFFNHPANWFMPFNAERSDVIEALGHDDALSIMLSEAPAMCDSDKYSFIFSLDRIPAVQKDMVMNQISSATMQMAEMADSEALPERVRRNGLVTRYIQDLYRFFRLFRRRSEFADPFDTIINPAAIPALKADFAHPEKIRLLGEFYFKHGHYEHALSLFRLLEPDYQIHQKMGHALQKLGLLREAVEEYERAEMLAPDSEWTLRRLAAAYKQLGDYRKALEYYKRLERMNPDNSSVALNIGHCYLQLNELQEALHSYYKAEMLDEQSTKPLRPIAWSAFLNRDFDTAKAYYDRLLSAESPLPADYLNLGHLSLAANDIREAMNYYGLYADGDIAKLAKSLHEDSHLLEQAGIDVSIVPIILDAIRFQYDK